MTSSSADELLSDLPRGLGPNQLGTAANAYFESAANLLATESLVFDQANTAGKQFLGVLSGRVQLGARRPDGRIARLIQGGVPLGVADDRHSMLLAGSRAGKGRAALVPLLITLPKTTPLLVLDPKGELARITARWRADGLSQQTKVLDPFECSGERALRFRAGFNPLASSLLKGANLVPNAKLIADSLIVAGDFKDKHWDETAKQILSTLIVHVLTHTNYANGCDLVTVWRLASELCTPDAMDPSQSWLQQEMLANDAAGGIVRYGARNFYARTGGEFSSVLSNLNKHLDWISMESMQGVLRGDSIDLVDVLTKSMSVYVSIPAMRMNDLSGWMRMLVQMFLVAAESIGGIRGRQAYAVLDEFHALGRMTALEKAIAQIAGFGVKMLIVLQDLNQLKQHYPHSFETFIANAGLLQIFGCSDVTTQEYVSKLLGHTPILSRGTNSPTFEQASRHAATGETWTTRSHPLLNAEEVGRYFARDDHKLRQLILRPGYRPMILQRVFYDQHELFVNKYDVA